MNFSGNLTVKIGGGNVCCEWFAVNGVGEIRVDFRGSLDIDSWKTVTIFTLPDGVPKPTRVGMGSCNGTRGLVGVIPEISNRTVSITNRNDSRKTIGQGSFSLPVYYQ